MKKSIGIPVDPPKQTCNEKNCVWHGSLPVRGRTFQGTVTSSKARNTVVVEWGYTHLVPKYERYERRKSRVVAHNPSCMKARQGDEVIIAECRPLSKTKNFVVVAVPKRRVEQTEFKVAEIENEAVKKASAKEKGKESRDSKAEKKADKARKGIQKHPEGHKGAPSRAQASKPKKGR
jgi:small subunit ribosomal protein S17